MPQNSADGQKSGNQRGAHDLWIFTEGGLSAQIKSVLAGSAITLFSILPIPSISIRTTSPTFSHFGGFIAAATPPGVPVETTVPGIRVNTVERVSTCAKQSKIRFLVFECWRCSPF